MKIFRKSPVIWQVAFFMLLNLFYWIDAQIKLYLVE